MDITFFFGRALFYLKVFVCRKLRITNDICFPENLFNYYRTKQVCSIEIFISNPKALTLIDISLKNQKKVTDTIESTCFVFINP